jgi:hypothetical protein
MDIERTLHLFFIYCLPQAVLHSAKLRGEAKSL